MSEPIGIRPGTYPVPGQEKPVMGLCIVLDDAEASWKISEKSDGAITITIPSDSPWRVSRVQDADEPDSYYLQVFRVGGHLNSIVLNSFIHPTEEVHTPNADFPDGEPPELRIHYTHPEKEMYTAAPVVLGTANAKKK